MLQFPYAVYPEGQAIDGTEDNVFYCTISGTMCTAYQVIIRNNVTNQQIYLGQKENTIKYNNEVLEMEIPQGSFQNGENLVWNMRLYTNLYDMLIGSGKIISGRGETSYNNKFYTSPFSTNTIKVGQQVRFGSKNYIIQNYDIKEIDGVSYGEITTSTNLTTEQDGDNFKIYSNFIDTPSYFFKSRSNPSVSITNMPTSINSKNFTFLGSYSQAEMTPLQYYIFNLYDGDKVLIDTTDKVYSYDINYSFDGFVNGEHYYIELICNSQDNVEVGTDLLGFNVGYLSPNVDISIECEAIDEEDCIKLILQPDKTSIPKFDGKYSIVENFPFNGVNSVDIEEGIITYDNISEKQLIIDEDSYSVFISTNLNDDFEGKILELSGDSGDRYVRLFGYIFYDNFGVVGKVYTTDKFVLQNEIEENVGYIWDNSAVWDNTKIWCSPIQKLSGKQFKISMLPTVSYVVEV